MTKYLSFLSNETSRQISDMYKNTYHGTLRIWFYTPSHQKYHISASTIDRKPKLWGNTDKALPQFPSKFELSIYYTSRDIEVPFEGFQKDKFHNVKTTDLTLLQCGAA